MYTNENGALSELNPKPLRVISTMGDVTVRDWFIFIVSIGLCLPIFFFLTPQNLHIHTNGGIIDMVIRAAFCMPVALIGAMLAFIQNPIEGKLRTRVFRWIRFLFSKKYLTPLELKTLYGVKEIKENNIHYKTSPTNEGVISVFRIEGFDPSLLENTQFNNLIEDFTQFFSVNVRFKLVSARITYTIPKKKIALDIDHYGVNFAKNRYFNRITEINQNEDLKQQAYFLVIDGPSIQKNLETFNTISSAISEAHINMVQANEEELSQLLNEIWCGGFNFEYPNISGIRNITFDSKIMTVYKKDGTHEYVSFLSYNSLPENASVCWLGHTFNNPNFSLIMDISPINSKDAGRYMDEMSNSADSIMLTKWFKKRASDTERLKISHLKDVVAQISSSIAEGQIQLKEVCFYLVFRDKTRKRLLKKINDFNEQTSTFSNGWSITKCKYMQKDALINTRLYDVPDLQYHKQALNMFNSGAMSYTGSRTARHSLINNSPILPAIEHKILSTSLGISYPFFSRSSIATEDTWFKGFVIDSSEGEANPFFNDYWKANEMYNSYNRFYQGRNGSGKSYTADIDLVCDRLDDKFVISIDPKPERDVMTKNLGGENLIIGSGDKNAPFINIFDVLITPGNEDKSTQNPLIRQYQANLTSMSILLSLDVTKPDDKIVLSCFNDVQVYIYEKVHKISTKTDFSKHPKNKYPIMKEFYDEAIKRYKKERVPETKTAFNKLIVLMKEHAIGVSSVLFNSYTNVDWSSNRMWNLVVRDIALNFGNKDILACWILNIIRVAESFMLSGQRVVLYIDELHLIHNINGVLAKLDEFARIDRSYKGALCLINQNFNSIRSTADAKKKEYYESIFTMSQYNFFFTTGEEDVMFLVDMLSGSGQPLSLSERSFITKAGRGKALLVMNAYDRYRVQFDISFWREIWEEDLEPIYKESLNNEVEVEQEENSEQSLIQAPNESEYTHDYYSNAQQQHSPDEMGMVESVSNQPQNIPVPEVPKGEVKK